MDLLLQRYLAAQRPALLREELDTSGRKKLLQRPASGEPSTFSEGIFPRYLVELRIGNIIRHCYIREEDIAFGRTLIPAEHRVDSRSKLIAGSCNGHHSVG